RATGADAAAEPAAMDQLQPRGARAAVPGRRLVPGVLAGEPGGLRDRPAAETDHAAARGAARIHRREGQAGPAGPAGRRDRGVRALGEAVPNLALVDLLPGGFEVVVQRASQTSDAADDSAATEPGAGEGEPGGEGEREGDGEPGGDGEGEPEGRGGGGAARAR